MNPIEDQHSTAHAGAAAEAVPGRSCPLHYRYKPEVFACEPSDALSGLDVLYVVGGLYGNELALQRVLELFEREIGRKRLVFNGDFHWFDTDPEVFARVQDSVLTHTAIRGNVETELAAEPSPAMPDAGCGCAYPDWVGDAVVERSNRILARLRSATTAVQRRALAELPMWLRAEAAGLQLGIVHGDAQSLAGWGFAQESLRESAQRDAARDWFARAGVDAFACTHTCLPVFQALRGADSRGRRWILNNGAAGMPNFAGDAAGLLTRIAATPFEGRERRYGVRAGKAHVEAIAIDVDRTEWQGRFLAQWPEGSDAHASYFERILAGPAYRPAEAVRIEDCADTFAIQP